MGDDLVDDWWVKEDIGDDEEVIEDSKSSSKKNKKKKQGVMSDTDKNSGNTDVLPKKKKKSKDGNVIKKDENGDEDPVKLKKKKKVKRKLDDSEKDGVFLQVQNKKKKKKKKASNVAEEYEPSFESLWKFFEEELGKSLSAIEIEDIKPDTSDWFLEESEPFSRDDPEQFSPYLKDVSSSWEKCCSVLTKKKIKGSPAMLLLTSSAQRAVDLLRHASSFKGGDCKSVKLFAKHFKVEDQVKYLGENIVHLAVGTPHRVLSLIENGSLKIEELKYVIVDWSWKDVKMRRILNMPNVKDDFILLFQKHIFRLCQKGTLSVGLF